MPSPSLFDRAPCTHPAWLRDKAEADRLQAIRTDVRALLMFIPTSVLEAFVRPGAMVSDIVADMVKAEELHRRSA